MLIIFTPLFVKKRQPPRKSNEISRYLDHRFSQLLKTATTADVLTELREAETSGFFD